MAQALAGWIDPTGLMARPGRRRGSGQAGPRHRDRSCGPGGTGPVGRPPRYPYGAGEGVAAGSGRALLARCAVAGGTRRIAQAVLHAIHNFCVMGQACIGSRAHAKRGPRTDRGTKRAMTHQPQPMSCPGDPARRSPTLLVRLRRTAEDCWRAGQLVVFFAVAAFIFGEPRPAPPTFTLSSATLTGAHATIAADVRPLDRGPAPQSPLDPGADPPEDRRL